MNNYSKEFKEQVVKKKLSGIPVKQICEETGVSDCTIYTWSKQLSKYLNGANGSATANPTSEKADLLIEYQGLSDADRGEWLRVKGLKTGHLELWTKQMDADSKKKKELKDEIRKLKEELKKAQKEIRKKDKALAESAALLVLKKKYQHLWEEEE